MSQYINSLYYPNRNVEWTDEESKQLAQYITMGYTPGDVARAMVRDECDVILHGITLGVLKVERVEQKLPIQPLGMEFNPNDWNGFSCEPRTLDKVIYMANVFRDKIWFAFHKETEYRVKNGLEHVDPNLWAKDQESAEKIVQEHGILNLGPYTDFEWGKLVGKLSALRWVLGYEWDFPIV